jgi:hypothetical protein
MGPYRCLMTEDFTPESQTGAQRPEAPEVPAAKGEPAAVRSSAEQPVAGNMRSLPPPGPPVPVARERLPYSGSDINVDLADSPLHSSGVSTAPIPFKERYARGIANYIVGIFGLALILLMIFGFVLLIWLRWAPDKADIIFNKAVIPFIEKVGTFATTVFGPLLAFILGYYFGEKSQASKAN